MHILVVGDSGEFFENAAARGITFCADAEAAVKSLRQLSVDLIVVTAAVEQSRMMTVLRDQAAATPVLVCAGAVSGLREIFAQFAPDTGSSKVISLRDRKTASHAAPTAGHTATVSDLGRRGLTECVDELESRMVLAAMAQTGNNQVKAAELLQITRGALQYKLKKYVKAEAA